MSYRNPQTVIDTESAKYYAQAISGIGQMGAQVITNFNKEQRDIAKANKKQNLLNSTNETKYNSIWLEKVNKGLTGKPIDLSNDLRRLLTPMIDKAAKINTELKNFSANPGESNEQYSVRKAGLQKELNSLETLFSSGTKNALENLLTRQSNQSEFGKTIGKEGGQSASATQPDMQTDIASTMSGTPNKEYNLGLIEMEDGSYNFNLGFADVDPSKARNYNLNKDLGEETMVVNPNISKPFTKALEDLQIIKKGAPNIESESLMGMVDGVTILTVGSKKYEIGKIDYDLFTNKVSDQLQGIVGGVVSMGNQADGNSGTGLATMQSWVDDVLPDIPFPGKFDGEGKPISYDDYVGTLELDSTTVHGLTKESYNKLQEAIVYQDYVKIQNGMKREEIKTNDSDGGGLTPTQKNIKSKETAAVKYLNSFGAKLEEAEINPPPKFVPGGGDTPEAVSRWKNSIQKLGSNIKVDVKTPVKEGGNTGYPVTVLNQRTGKNITRTIDSGMSPNQVKMAIFQMQGATDEEIERYKYGKVNDVITEEIPEEIDTTGVVDWTKP
jgi:hypothetical protein